MLEAFVTEYGLNALATELREKVKTFVIFGSKRDDDAQIDELINTEASYEKIENFIFYQGVMERGYFDENGLLSYEVNLKNIVADYYSYGMMIIDENKKSLATIKMPKIKFFTSVGGEIVIKLPITGEKNQVIFTHNEYVSYSEFESYKNQEKVDVITKANQVLLLALSLRDKKKRERQEYERIGKKEYFVCKPGKDYIEVGKMVKASDCLILWHKMGIKEREFKMLTPNVYTKGGAKLGFNEQALPDMFLNNVPKNMTRQSLFYRGGGGAGSAGISYEVGVNLSDYSKLYRGDSVEVKANVCFEAVYKGNF